MVLKYQNVKFLTTNGQQNTIFNNVLKDYKFQLALLSELSKELEELMEIEHKNDADKQKISNYVKQITDMQKFTARLSKQLDEMMASGNLIIKQSKTKQKHSTKDGTI